MTKGSDTLWTAGMKNGHATQKVVIITIRHTLHEIGREDDVG